MFSANIKVYQQITIHPNDQHLREFLGSSNFMILSYYQLTAVITANRTTSVPLLAIRCLKKLADNSEQLQPKNVNVLHKDFFADDVSAVV